VDSVAKLESLIDAGGRIGGEADTFVSHVLAVLALSSAQRPVPEAAVETIKNAQQENGSWAWDGTAETAGDTNTTAFAVQALTAAGEDAAGDAVVNALAYYKGIQNEDGGWPYQNPSDYGTDTDANSTAVTIQAIIAAGQDPASANWTVGESTPVAALEALQNESGAFAWQAAIPADNLLATVQALPALAGKAFPLATMDVGQPTPTTVPETGGGAVALALPLLLSGLALAGGGYLLKRGK
jgi:squalene cyclase